MKILRVTSAGTNIILTLRYDNPWFPNRFEIIMNMYFFYKVKGLHDRLKHINLIYEQYDWDSLRMLYTRTN